MTETWEAVQKHSRSVAGVSVAALGFSLPISTSLDGILLVITVIAWAISGAYRDLSRLVRGNRLILLLPGLFVVIALGMVHGMVPFGVRAKYLWKHDDLLLPLVFVPLLADVTVRERALWAFGAGMTLTLLISLCLATGLIPKSSWFHGETANATVFKLQITHNILMAVTALLFAEVAVGCRVSWQRYVLGLLAFGAVIDVFMLVQGRTGQIVLGLLILLWCERRLGWRGVTAGVVVVAALLVMSFSLSPVFQKRVEKTVTEIQQSKVDVVAPEASSVGLRLEWYKNTARLVTTHPLVGVGTGSFAEAYREMVTEPNAVKPAHPHNQYLLTASDLGIGGVGVLLGVFGWLWWWFRSECGHLYSQLGQGVVITMAVGCVFNSFLIDHTEGLFFAWMVSAALATNPGEEGGHPC
ncbi:MAG: O-antigen ligase family protein [Nitrospira sp.]|nr:O-antigen ligase family protein [Nitrospira sp.]